MFKHACVSVRHVFALAVVTSCASPACPDSCAEAEMALSAAGAPGTSPLSFDAAARAEAHAPQAVVLGTQTASVLRVSSEPQATSKRVRAATDRDQCRHMASAATCRAYDAEKYTLLAEVDWQQQKLLASETIELTLWNTRSALVDLDAAVSVRRVHAQGRPLAYRLDEVEHVLRVDLSPIARGQRRVSFVVDYEAKPSAGLHFPSAPRVDPVTARALYTFSEPDVGNTWLVANHDPADRAAFAVELRLGRGDDLVANGERVRDQSCGRERCVRYEQRAPVPTYVMAFASGELVHTDRTSGGVPLSVWRRRGLPVASAAILDEMARVIRNFSELLGPFPWQRYSVVLLPELTAAVEHTTIGFLSEGQTITPRGSVLAHELAHEWFGNWMTIRSFDDLWIKEGMATLLQLEAQRYRLDERNTGSFLGDTFYFDPTDAIRDRELQGLAKYTAGPYERGAWLLTQIRARVGERAFWHTLRQTLTTHALGSITSEDFLQGFVPVLGAAGVRAALASLDLHTAPEASYAIEPGADSTGVTLTLSDPERSLLFPPTLTVVDAAGRAQVSQVLADQPLSLSVPAGGYLAPEERAVHPMLSFGPFGEELLPSAPGALRAFGRRSPSHQALAVSTTTLFTAEPQGFTELHRRLDSADARLYAEWQLCFSLQTLPQEAPLDAWITELAPLLRAPHEAWPVSPHGACGTVLANSLFGEEFATSAARPSAENLERFTYLMGYDYGAERVFDVLERVAANAASRGLRDMVYYRLTSQLVEADIYSPVPDAEFERWSLSFRERLALEPSAFLVDRLARALGRLGDASACPAMAEALLRVRLNATQQRRVICAAHEASAAAPAAWTSFQAALVPWDRLTPAARAVLQNPDLC